MGSLGTHPSYTALLEISSLFGGHVNIIYPRKEPWPWDPTPPSTALLEISSLFGGHINRISPRKEEESCTDSSLNYFLKYTPSIYPTVSARPHNPARIK